MTCVEEWRKKFEALGLWPMPPHLVAFVEALCAGAPPAEVAEYVFRLHSWPARLLDISRSHEISDEAAESLLDLYLAAGENDAFEKAVGALPCKETVVSPLPRAAPAAEMRIVNVNEKLRSRKGAIFDRTVEEERKARGANAPQINTQELERLKALFISTGMSEKDLRSQLASAAAKQFKL